MRNHEDDIIELTRAIFINNNVFYIQKQNLIP